MYIKSLYLKNIRSYCSQEIEFSNGINLLIGANNSGKSTIIKALYKTQKGNSLVKQDVRKTKQRGQIAIRFESVTAENLYLFRSKENSPGFNNLLEGGKITVLYGMQAADQVGEGSYMYDPDENIKRIRNDVLGENEKGEEARLIEFTSLPDKESEQNFIYPFFARRKYYGSYHHGGIDATYRVHEDLSNLAAKIQNVGNSSHPQNVEFNRLCDEILKFRVGLIPGEQQESKIGIFVNNSTTIPLEAMGEGVLNVLGLIVILLTEDKKLFLIEELENDLHPAALKKLLQLIIKKADRNQFIISSHSNIVVKYLGSVPGSTLSHITWEPFENDVQGVVHVPTSQVETVSQAPEARMSMLEDLGYDLFDYGMYSGFLILEESSAEQVIRDFLIPNFTPSLMGRLRTIASQGANDLLPKFNDLHRLFLFVHSDPVYKNRAWAVGDGDQAGIENIAKLKSQFSSWPESHFITLTQPAFELYFPIQFQEEVIQILALESKRDKKEKKSKLLRKVLDWTRTNPEEAKQAFEVSAAEIIQLLYKIQQEV